MGGWKFECGQKVIEKSTGFVGTIICKTIWANGQITYGVQPKAMDDGTMLPNYEVFDEAFLEEYHG